jgi:hypothetical protein
MKLALQPWANKMRKDLGQRFVAPGMEVTTMIGTLTIGLEAHSLVMVRTQTEDGEQVDIGLDHDSPTLSWNPERGAYADGAWLDRGRRSLIERLALDSPDEFILAQLRGASYYPVASNVRPSEAGSSITYSGPTWDAVRIGEPSKPGQPSPESPWRLYYINTKTGMIDRISSREDRAVLAQISGWSQRNGEVVPTHITWSQNNQTIMELVLSSVTFGPSH